MVYRSNMCLILGGLMFFCFLGTDANGLHGDVVPKVATMRFLVSVNDTWDPDGCIATVVTPTLIPDKKYNMSDSFQVGDCDHGPLTFTVQSSNGRDSKYNVNLTFYSSVILDAPSPTCNLPWNGTYLVPKEAWIPDQDLLPSCFTAMSREGYHMTYYWFHIFDWTFH